MPASSFFRPALLLAAVSLLASCASVSVKNVAASDARPVQPPAVIYVTAFSIQGTKIKENPYRQRPGRLGEDARQLLAAYLVEELKKAGLPATAATGGPAKANAWIIDGQITRVAEGSRLLRMGLGLGMGGTKLETKVQVRKAGAAKPFLAFATTGGSNATPGAATNPIPFSSAPQALLNSKDGITDDSARTARMITGTLAHYMVEHGLLKTTSAPVPKMSTQ